MKADYSKEILEKYFNKRDKILKITLNNGVELQGILVSFFHGNKENKNEPFIIKWHFIDKKDIVGFNKFSLLDKDEEMGRIIEQKDIKAITFM